MLNRSLTEAFGDDQFCTEERPENYPLSKSDAPYSHAVPVSICFISVPRLQPASCLLTSAKLRSILVVTAVWWR